MTDNYISEKTNDEWVRLQQKTFTRWCNVHLGERVMKINDLLTDLSDGIMLCNLLEIISSKSIKFNQKIRNNFHRAENLNAALAFIRSEGIVLVNTGQEDISNGNQRIILGLIWTIILRYQIQKGDGKKSPKQDLLDWVNKQIKPYGLQECKGFTNDFQNGWVLNTLCDCLEPGLIDLNDVKASQPMKNNAQALNLADSKFDIPAILDPIDIVRVPDEHSMMTYVSYFRAYEANRAKDLVPHAPQCFADGPGVEGGKLGTGPLPFTVHTMNRKGKPIPRGEASYTIAAFAPDGSPLEVTQVDNGDGTISCEYCPVMPGDHRVAVQLGNAQIKGSVYRPFVKPSADPSKSYAEGPGLVSARDDEPGLFTVYAKDPDGNPVAGANPIVQVVPSDGKTLDAEVKDNGNGTYSVSYPPLPAGDATVYVRLGDQDIKDTPVVVNVTKGINSTTTFADGPGVAPSVFVGRPMPFVIHACDEDANPLTKGGDNFVINFRGPQGPIKVNCEDAKNGNYPCSYTAPMNANGPATLDIVNKRDNKSIKDCPLQINLKLPADHSKSYAEGPGLQKAWDDRENSFTIYAFDRNNQPVVGEDVKVLLAYPTDGKGAAPARATPSPSASVSNEPEFLTVTETEMAKFCAECGEGNQKAKFCWNCGAKTRIKEVTKQVPNPNFRRGAAAAPQASAGAVNYTHEGKVVDNGDGTYACTYAVQLGMPVVVINAHIYGKEIRGVPVRLQVTKGASAAQSTADGPGVESGFVNRPHRFKITARDEDGKPLATGGDNFQATVTDPNGNDVPCTVIDNGNGTYSAGYVPTVVGPHTVQVDLLKNGASDAIRDMPKTANVRKGASGKNSYMKGKGLRWAYEGRSNTFEVRRFTDTSKETLEQTLLRPLSFVFAFDENGRPVAGEKIDMLIARAETYDEFSLEQKVLRDGKSQEYQDYKALESVPAEMLVDTSTLNSRALVTPTITDNRNGSYTVVYVPSMTGEYVIDCRLYDEHVQRSPARLSVYFNCPHKECQDAMAVLHNELLSYEEKETGAAAQAPAGPSVEQKQAQELKSLRTILAGKQNLSNEGISGLKQLLADEQTARAAAEKEVKRLRDLLAALQQ